MIRAGADEGGWALALSPSRDSGLVVLQRASREFDSFSPQSDSRRRYAHDRSRAIAKGPTDHLGIELLRQSLREWRLLCQLPES
jgi:hypothetical protein